MPGTPSRSSGHLLREMFQVLLGADCVDVRLGKQAPPIAEGGQAGEPGADGRSRCSVARSRCRVPRREISGERPARPRRPFLEQQTTANEAYGEAAGALAASRDAADASRVGDTAQLARATDETRAHAAQARLHADNAMYLLPVIRLAARELYTPILPANSKARRGEALLGSVRHGASTS
jgi:hypothetical protein